jgi:hypothetical protein
MLREAAGVRKGVRVFIEKRIPIGSALAAEQQCRDGSESAFRTLGTGAK